MLRRAEREIKRNRHDGKSSERRDGRRAAQLDARYDGRRALMIGRGQQPAADLDARGVRFGAANQPCGNVAFDLGELILVDDGLAAVVLRPRTATQWPEHGEDRRSRHQREHKPQRHRAGSDKTAPTAPMRRFTPPAPSRATNNSLFAMAADKSRNPVKMGG